MLEEAIKENTTVLRALLAALTSGASLAAGVPAKAPAKDTAASKTPADAAKPQTSAALDYEKDVKPLALRVAKEKNRDALVAILATFGVAQANLLKPEQFGPFTTACNAALHTVPA